MKVKFYNFSKRTKSTKQPTGDGTELTVYWKDATSILNPTILCSTDISGYNYCYIPAWNRYYHYAGLQTVENMWEVKLSEDPFASWKTVITSTSCNVLFATGGYNNIVDSRIPVKSIISSGIEYGSISGLVWNPNGSGTTIIGITGLGSFGCYLLDDPSKLPELLDGVDVTTVTDTLDMLKQWAYGGSAAQNLKSAIVIPATIPYSDISTNPSENLFLGSYPCKDSNGNAITGHLIDKPVITRTGAVSIPWQANYPWLKVSTYTNISLYLPMIGTMNIPATEVQNDDVLDFIYAINITSGDISVQVKGHTSEKIVGNASGNCALNTPFGNTGIDTNKLTAGVVSGIGATIGVGAAIATGGASIPATLAIGAGYANFAGQLIASMGGTGTGSAGLGGGSSVGTDLTPKCFVTQKVLTDDPANLNAIIGKPVMKVSTPGSFSGYVQTDGFQIESTGMYESERESINSGMDSGVYIE